MKHYEIAKSSSGLSYKASTSVNYNSGVLFASKWLIFTNIET